MPTALEPKGRGRVPRNRSPFIPLLFSSLERAKAGCSGLCIVSFDDDHCLELTASLFAAHISSEYHTSALASDHPHASCPRSAVSPRRRFTRLGEYGGSPCCVT